MHVDTSNAGLRLIITLGPVAPGATWAMQRNQQVLLPRFEWVELDGNQPHMTLPYLGDRVSIVLFAQATALTPYAMTLLRQAVEIGMCVPSRFDRVSTSGTAELLRRTRERRATIHQHLPGCVGRNRAWQ